MVDLENLLPRRDRVNAKDSRVECVIRMIHSFDARTTFTRADCGQGCRKIIEKSREKIS